MGPERNNFDPIREIQRLGEAACMLGVIGSGVISAANFVQSLSVGGRVEEIASKISFNSSSVPTEHVGPELAAFGVAMCFALAGSRMNTLIHSKKSSFRR